MDTEILTRAFFNTTKLRYSMNFVPGKKKFKSYNLYSLLKLKEFQQNCLWRNLHPQSEIFNNAMPGCRVIRPNVHFLIYQPDGILEDILFSDWP